jgi:hypothetical protein
MSRYILNVPYKSQNDPDAQTENNDCGPACVAMILLTQGHSVATSEVYAASSVAQDRPLSFAEVTAAAAHFGLPLNARIGMSLQDLRNYIDQGTPVIALVKYLYLPDRQGQSTTGGHFVLVVGYDDDAGEILINDPYYWASLRDQGDHHHYSYDTWEQAWGRCNEDGNPNHSALVPQPAQPAAPLPDYAPTPPPPGTVFVLPAADKYGGLKLRPVRDTNVAGQAIFSGRPLTVVEGPVTIGSVTWVLVRTQSADDIAGWACVQSGGEAYIGDRPGATTPTTISPVTPPARLAYVWPDADRYGGLKLRPQRDVTLGGPVEHSGTVLNVVADPVGSGDNEWLLVTAQDGNDTAGWVHVRQGSETYVADTPPGGAPTPPPPPVEPTTLYVQPSVTPYGGLKVRVARDINSATIEVLGAGAAVTVLAGPVAVGNDVWVQVQTQAGNVGWARSQGDSEIYLAPGQLVADVRPFGKCLAGVGMANPQPLMGEEVQAIARSQVASVKVLTLPDPDENKQLIQTLRNVRQDMFIVARLFFSIDFNTKSPFSPQNFADFVNNGLMALYQVGVRYFEVHNEPNLKLEGLEWNWRDGAEFGNWFTQVLGILRQRCPEGKFGFPGLSPQFSPPDTPVLSAESDVYRFLTGAAPAIAQSDWVGVHCYWQNDSDGHWGMLGENDGMFWKQFRTRYPDKLLMITEFSNNSAGVTSADKGQQYARYFELLRNEPNLGAAFAFALSWPGQDANHEGWVLNNQMTAIPMTLGPLIARL